MEGKRWTTISPLLDELLDLTGVSRARRLAQIEAAWRVVRIEAGASARSMRTKPRCSR